MSNSNRVAGGLARARSLTAERRMEIAQKAAAVRWGKPPGIPKPPIAKQIADDFFDANVRVKAYAIVRSMARRVESETANQQRRALLWTAVAMATLERAAAEMNKAHGSKQ
jgi:hypothetical protein